MEILRRLRYWILWMLKRQMVTPPHVITANNDMFDHRDGIMQPLPKKNTLLKEDFYFAMKCARQKLPKYHAEVSPVPGTRFISAQILEHFRKLRSFWEWGKGMHINPEDETSYTTQYQEACLKYVQNKYCAKLWHLPIITPESVQSNNLFSSTMAQLSGKSYYDPYDLSSDDEEYSMPKNVAKTTSARSDRTACLVTASRLYLNSPPEFPQHCGQNYQNDNDYHSNLMEISSTFWIPHSMDWWHQQEQTHSTYTNLPNVACNIISIIPPGVRVEASFSLGRDLIGWR